MRPTPDGVGENLKSPDFNSHNGGEVARHVQSQLTNSTPDIKAAHQWIQPSGGSAHLPSVSFRGVEAASFHAAVPGSESTALAAAHHAGNQAISPIIQMIMRMPGHLGLASSFFEALSSFFAPIKEMLGSLDASFLAQHAEAALHSTSQALGEHMPIDVSLLPGDAPILNMEDGTGLGQSLADSASTHLDLNQFHSAEPFTDTRDALNTSGFGDGKFQFERSATMDDIFKNPTMPGSVDQRYLAMDNGQAIFRPTIGGAQSIPNAAQAPSVPDPTSQPIVQPTSQPSAPHNPIAHAKEAAAQETADRGTLLGHPHPRVEPPTDQSASEQVAENPQAAEATEQGTASYTVKAGDNLWNIARHHLGDGLKWQEIYHLNQEIIGSNPTIIHPGTTIQLPGAEVASNYTVQPGDNLWNISKDHLGNAENWHSLYQHNADVIGANPSLIHPGQHLSLNEQAMSEHSHLASAHSEQHLANASGHTHHASHTAQVAHAGSSPTHHLASNSAHAGAHHQLASNTGHEHHAYSAANSEHHEIASSSGAQSAHAADNQVAHAQPTHQVAEGSQQVPEAIAQTPGGHETIALRAQQPMMALDPSAPPQAAPDAGTAAPSSPAVDKAQ